MLVSPASWSYYGAAHRYDLHKDTAAHARCEETMRRLRESGLEDELRALAWDGDRCAVITLLEILVDQDRSDDLRTMADDGDDRAGTTLMEMLANQAREEELRHEVAAGRGHVRWLLGYLLARERTDDALLELAHWVEEHPDDAGWARAERIDLLLQSGRVAEVERAAEAGDHVAIRRLRKLRPAAPPVAPEQP